MEDLLYDFLQAAIPEGLQLINPYQNGITIPNDDFGQIVLQEWTPSGENQEKLNKWYINNIYKFTLYFYGPNAFVNAKNSFQSIILITDMLLKEKESLNDYELTNISLKKWSSLTNKSYLLDNKEWIYCWSFDLYFFAVSEFAKEYAKDLLQKVQTKIIALDK